MQACKYIEEHLAVDVDSLGKDALINCAKTSMSSKIIGAESDFFSKVGFALAANSTCGLGVSEIFTCSLLALSAPSQAVCAQLSFNGVVLHVGHRWRWMRCWR